MVIVRIKLVYLLNIGIKILITKYAKKL